MALELIVEPWPPKIFASKLFYSAQPASGCNTTEVWQHLLVHCPSIETWVSPLVDCQ